MLNRVAALGTALLIFNAMGNVAAAAQQSNRLLARPAAVTSERLLKGTDLPNQWPSYGGGYSEQRFSPLRRINDQNVQQLGLAWFADYETNQNQHGSPLYIDGVIYVSTARNVVHAYDARNGNQLWKYNPNIQGERLRYNLGLVNRGIAAWNGKIYMGTLDARLVAIDAKTGKEAWSVDTAPAGLGLGDMANKYSITMAPRIAKGKVFIGGSGGEYGVRGWIAAFDAESGKEVWRFWTVPGDPAKGFESPELERAAKTWSGQWWKSGGGGTVWDAALYDPQTDLLYFGTGNGAPWNATVRNVDSGDNLFVASIIAVRPDTGQYVWHYQQTPGDSWDYDAVSPMLTADLTFGGSKKHVLIQPSKNGFMYVWEAATGKLLSADPFTEVNWASGVDMNTGRPIEVPGARYEKEPWNVAPGAPGGHTWHPNAFSPVTGLVYIPTWENYGTMANLPPVDPSAPARAGGFSLGVAFGVRVDPKDLKPYARSSDTGLLKAWDPIARKVVWSSKPGPRATSGVLATGGNLVFMGNSGGKKVFAYDARNGTELWSFDAQTAVYAAPITYELGGVQYIAASVGGVVSGGDYFAPTYARMLVFKVGGKAKLPAPTPYTPLPLNPPASVATPATIARGSEVYTQHCSVCHGANGLQARTSFPNLTVTPLLHSQEGFDQVVLRGVRAERGMGSFAKDLTAADSAAIRQYLITRAIDLKNRPPGAAAGGRAARPAPAPAPAPTTPAPTAGRDVHEEAATSNR